MEERWLTVHVDDTVFPLASSDNKVPRLSGASVALSLTSKTVFEDTVTDAIDLAETRTLISKRVNFLEKCDCSRD